MTTEELYQELRSAIQENRTNVSNLYFGYFLQFKPVEKRIRRTKSTPEHYTTPYFNTKLSLQPNKTTGLSQHETLLRLNQVFGAIVQYACAMLFDPSDIWQTQKLSKLRLVDISTAPSRWATNQQHYIAFQTEDDPSPYWCSDPIEGKSFNINDWIYPDHEMINPVNSEQLIDLISKAYATVKGTHARLSERSIFGEGTDLLNFMPESFTILELSKKPKKQPKRVIRKLHRP